MNNYIQTKTKKKLNLNSKNNGHTERNCHYFQHGGLFCSQSDADSEYRNRFRIGANLKIFVLRMRQLSLKGHFSRSP